MLQQSYHTTLDDEIPSNILEYRNVDPEVKPIAIEYVDIFAAIDRLEAKILNSPRVPLTGKTVVNEEELLEQLDAIRLNLPEIVNTAQEILQYKDRLIREAQQQVQQILAQANQHAYQVANELGIIDRSEQEARQIRQMAIAECEQLRQQAIIEIERVRERNIQEIEQMRERALAECQLIQSGADEYADRVLYTMEERLTDILQAIQQGRQRLNTSEPESSIVDLRQAS
jgi:cell division septum initiation protein DivIVA